MSWSLGFDTRWNRDIGYGVVAFCDHPGCGKEIDRGLAYVCGGEPYGGERGCGLYFCSEHRAPSGFRSANGKIEYAEFCARCAPKVRKPFAPSQEHPLWVWHKLTDGSWADWRKENAQEVQALREKYSATLDMMADVQRVEL